MQTKFFNRKINFTTKLFPYKEDKINMIYDTILITEGIHNLMNKGENDSMSAKQQAWCMRSLVFLSQQRNITEKNKLLKPFECIPMPRSEAETHGE